MKFLQPKSAVLLIFYFIIQIMLYYSLCWLWIKWSMFKQQYYSEITLYLLLGFIGLKFKYYQCNLNGIWNKHNFTLTQQNITLINFDF